MQLVIARREGGIGRTSMLYPFSLSLGVAPNPMTVEVLLT